MQPRLREYRHLNIVGLNTFPFAGILRSGKVKKWILIFFCQVHFLKINQSMTLNPNNEKKIIYKIKSDWKLSKKTTTHPKKTYFQTPHPKEGEKKATPYTNREESREGEVSAGGERCGGQSDMQQGGRACRGRGAGWGGGGRGRKRQGAVQLRHEGLAHANATVSCRGFRGTF